MFWVTMWMAGALLSFMAMALGGRETAGELNTFQILFFRSVVGLLLIMILLHRSGWDQIKTQNFGLHFIRNVAHFGGQFGWFYGIAYISLAEVFAIEFTVPIWTAIAATVFLGEKLTPPRVAVIVLGITGIMIILRPGAGLISIPALAVLGGALGFAMTHILTKKLTHQSTPLCILFYMTLVQLPMGFIPSLENWLWPSTYGWFWLVILGITAMSAHYCVTKALKLADATVVVPMDFLRLPLIALVGFVFYGETIDSWLVVGAVTILVGILLNIQGENRKLKLENTPN
ncbi:hypothetical protein BGP75_00500 [Motiliproteus sp. MSK22-1]|nr:hypothetical protein BGP75_00500 [Motiliproteus sp. MSK22-1]